MILIWQSSILISTMKLYWHAPTICIFNHWSTIFRMIDLFSFLILMSKWQDLMFQDKRTAEEGNLHVVKGVGGTVSCLIISRQTNCRWRQLCCALGVPFCYVHLTLSENVPILEWQLNNKYPAIKICRSLWGSPKYSYSRNNFRPCISTTIQGAY